MKTYFYSGAFDPFTTCDLDALFMTLQENCKVVIGLEIDSEKPALFSVAERMEMIQQSVQWYAKTAYCTTYETVLERISIVSYTGLPIYEAKKHGADAFLIATDKTKTYDVKFDLSQQIARNKLSSQIGHKFRVCDKSPDDLAKIIKLCYKHHEYIMLALCVAPPVHNMLMEKLLEKQYFECCRQSNISWEDFCSQMSTRAYHNLSHIAYMLDKYDVFKTSITEDIDFATEKNFKAAIFFHDYVADDEEKSFEASKLGEAVKPLFMATKHFEPLPDDLSELEQLIIDLDLAIFTDKLLYKRYAKSIRVEYKHIPHDEYVGKRTEILKKLKEVIEERTHFTKLQKETAYKNIDRELEYLKCGFWPYW